MESSQVEHSLPKPYIDHCENNPSVEIHDLGLGFQSPTSPDHVPNLDPPPPADVDQRITSEEFVDQEVQKLTLISEEVQNQKPIDPPPPPLADADQQIANGERSSLNQEEFVDREVQNQIPICEEVQDQKPISDEDVQDQEPVSEELLYMKTVCEELEKLVLEEEEKVREGSSFLGKDHEAGSGLDVGLKTNDHGNDSEMAHHDDDEKSENEVPVMNGNYGRYQRPVRPEAEDSGRYQHPVRPEAEDCSFFLKTGMCKFGPACKFNHPPKRWNQWNQGAKEKVKEMEENSDWSGASGQTDCKYFMLPGGCKYGKACRFRHGKDRSHVTQTGNFNFLGLPIRPGEKECPFYMRNGSCKYGTSCRFHHPDPTDAGVADSGYANGDSASYNNPSQSKLSSWSPRALNDNNQFGPMMFPPTQAVSPKPEWTPYQAPAYVAPQRRLPTPPAFAPDSLAESNFYGNQRQQMPVDEFPERPGQPECSFYMKTGDCKYKFACKFHHPKNRVGRAPQFSLSDKGLPLRPDQNICSHYSRYGICKFGPACKFNHPKNYDPSDSPFGMSTAPDGMAMVGGGGMQTRVL